MNRRKNEVPGRLRSFAQEQRAMLTRAEDLLWQQIRAGRFHGLKFKRQVPIVPFIVDFLHSASRVVVELDGPPHESAEQRARDAERDRWLRAQGFEVLRFSNDLVLGNCQLVLDAIREAVESRHPPSPAPLCGAPSPASGGG